MSTKPVERDLFRPSLTAQQIGTLRQLGKIGYVRGLREQLDVLERDTPEAREYIGPLRDLVSEFRLDAFMAALDAAIPAHEGKRLPDAAQ